jgi:predicted nucleic acid-binding Zn ribbon protein
MSYYYCVNCDTACWVKKGDEIVCSDCGALLEKEEDDESETDNY